MPLRYLLDTNVLSELMRSAPNTGVLDRIDEALDTIATAALVWHEIEFGRLRLPNGKRRREIDRLAAGIAGSLSILPYDTAAARWHTGERARLVAAGKSPPFVDGQIAAVAAVHDLILVTRNVRDFSRFKGLGVESWFT